MGQHSDDAEPAEAPAYVRGVLDGVGLMCVLVLLVFGVAWLLTS